MIESRLGFFIEGKMMPWVNSLMTYLFSLGKRHTEIADPAEKLLRSMTLTAKCRYNAAVRIKWFGQLSFHTTTILSLGLILIPLLQNSGIKLAYQDKTVNMIQIFLAVALLVYSVLNSAARYDVRAEKLNDCGDKIKELIRQMRIDIHAKNLRNELVDLNLFHQRYTNISTDSENHSRADHALAIFETPEYGSITGFPFLWRLTKARAAYVIPYTIPAAMILFELIFILDMLGVTRIFVNYFHSSS